MLVQKVTIQGYTVHHLILAISDIFCHYNVWDDFIKNPLDGSKPTCKKCRQVVRRGSSTAKAKTWGNGPLWTHLRLCGTLSSSSSTQLNLQQTFALNMPFGKDSIKAKAITHAIGVIGPLPIYNLYVVINFVVA